MERVSIDSFSQTHALLEHSQEEDWRKLPRVFPHLEKKHSSLPTFRAFLCGIADQIQTYNAQAQKLDIVAHHMKVVTTKERVRGNSPEGIHQDGYPFLVTALVVERLGVTGGESQVFDEDKKTKIFTTTLRPGQGILQPDLGSHLWHHVTPIAPEQSKGVRSVIGLDIDIVR
ncbi:MAG: 2OG-Fe dioxygenase family protein [Verrucomicrobiota bacterium]|nr:2OG-Fe dioxygenase family protein [Verrucomicrobiota bacterium]